MPTARFLVSGRVQGVLFRASTREEALRLGVTGIVSNLADGRVEAVASGSDAALDALERWLRKGSPAARVDDVVRESIGDRPMQGFRIV